MDLRFTELMAAADIFTMDSLKLKPNEKLAIITDTRNNDKICQFLV